MYQISNVIGNKVYLEDLNGDVLERWYRPEELLHVDEVQHIAKDINQPIVHTKTKKTKKIMKKLKEEGVNEVDVIEKTKRQPAQPKPKPIPKPKLVHKPKKEKQEFTVKAIHGTQKVKGTTFYITEWHGFPNKQDFTYEPASNLKGNRVFNKWKTIMKK